MPFAVVGNVLLVKWEYISVNVGHMLLVDGMYPCVVPGVGITLLIGGKYNWFMSLVDGGSMLLNGER